MGDHGPHSGECAHAQGAICHCDCHGAQHGIVHLDGPHAERLARIVAVRHPAGGYHVTDKTTGRPPGGGTMQERLDSHASKVKVTGTTQRPHRFDPTFTGRVSKVRASLPTDRAGWDASMPQVDSPLRTRLLRQVKAAEEDAAEAREKADAFLETMRQRMRNSATTLDQAGNPGYAYTEAEIRKITRPGSKDAMRWPEYKNPFKTALWHDEEAARLRVAADAAGYDAVYQMDATGTYPMPSDGLNAQLDDVMDVGREALASLHTAFENDTELRGLAEQIAQVGEYRRVSSAYYSTSDPKTREHMLALRAQLPSTGSDLRPLKRQQARREQYIIRHMLAEARSFGGHRHTATPAAADSQIGSYAIGPARADWQSRLRNAEHLYPTDWLRVSAQEPLDLVSTERAFYQGRGTGDGGTLAMSTPARDADFYTGAFFDATDEVTVHEMGHRMEQMIPGLTHLEFAMVRRRAVGANGAMPAHRKLSDVVADSSYAADEVTFEDQWAHGYTGKTYELPWGTQMTQPGRSSWELFQVGTQDLFGRGTSRFGDDQGELQAFVLGALLTLGTPAPAP